MEEGWEEEDKINKEDTQVGEDVFGWSEAVLNGLKLTEETTRSDKVMAGAGARIGTETRSNSVNGLETSSKTTAGIVSTMRLLL